MDASIGGVYVDANSFFQRCMEIAVMSNAEHKRVHMHANKTVFIMALQVPTQIKTTVRNPSEKISQR